MKIMKSLAEVQDEFLNIICQPGIVMNKI